MKGYVLVLLVAALLVPAAAFSMEERQEREGPERQMEMRNREMDMQQREAKMDFEQKVRQLELEQRKLQLERERLPKKRPLMDRPPVERLKDVVQKHKEGPHPLLLLIGVVHILAAVWVYTDIRERSRGSGLWVVITLLAGLLGALVYAVVRLGDTAIQKKTV